LIDLVFCILIISFTVCIIIWHHCLSIIITVGHPSQYSQFEPPRREVLGCVCVCVCVFLLSAQSVSQSVTTTHGHSDRSLLGLAATTTTTTTTTATSLLITTIDISHISTRCYQGKPSVRGSRCPPNHQPPRKSRVVHACSHTPPRPNHCRITTPGILQ
jgi:hypothetical protein